MKNKKRLLALCLASLFALMALAACAPDAQNSEPAESTVSQEESSEESFTLPKKDMGGEEIVFLVPDSTYSFYESFEIYAEELNNEVINDAVYNRNAAVEDYYSCTILAEKDTSIAAKCRTYVDSNLTDYDVYMPMMNEAVAIAADGFLYDLYGIEQLNLDKPWWDQTANKGLTLGGKLFFTTGDISTLDNDCTMVMFFNKALIRDNALESPYDLVSSHKWTLDKVYTMSRDFTADNGNGVYDNEDKYGLHVAFNAPHSFFFGGGGRITETAEDGTVSLVMDSEANVSLLEKIFEISYAPDVLTNKTKGCSTFETVCEMFTNNQVIFTTFALIDIRQFRYAKNFEFGILPYPLYDENQKDYTCLISTGLVPGVCFANNCDNLENAALVVEAMAYGSVDTLTPAYYEQTLTFRDLQDDESGEMLDIIFASRTYDIGYICNWGGVGLLIHDMNSESSSDFISRFDAIRESVNTAMAITLEGFEAN